MDQVIVVGQDDKSSDMGGRVFGYSYEEAIIGGGGRASTSLQLDTIDECCDYITTLWDHIKVNECLQLD